MAKPSHQPNSELASRRKPWAWLEVSGSLSDLSHPWQWLEVSDFFSFSRHLSVLALHLALFSIYAFYIWDNSFWFPHDRPYLPSQYLTWHVGTVAWVLQRVVESIMINNYKIAWPMVWGFKIWNKWHFIVLDSSQWQLSRGSLVVLLDHGGRGYYIVILFLILGKGDKKKEQLMKAECCQPRKDFLDK